MQSLALLPVLRSETQASLLAALVLEGGADHTLTSLAGKADVDPSTMLREVDRLEEAGILTTRRLGRSRLVTLNERSPLVGPIRELVTRALGPVPLLASALGAVPGIEAAYVFGSWAAASAGAAAGTPDDIDVLVVGDPDRDRVMDAVLVVERRIGRPVDVTFRTAAEWEDESDPFVATVRSRPMIQLT